VRPRTLLILLVVVAGLGLFIWFGDRKLPSSDERAKQAKKVFAELKREDVTGLAIQWEGRDVRMERVKAPPAAKKAGEKADNKSDDRSDDVMPPAADWQLTRPVAARADALAVNGFLDSLTGLEKTRTLDHPDPRALGLDKPQATVRLVTTGGEKTLTLGAKIPTGGEVVASVSGDADAYVVSDSILSSLKREPGEWRDRQIVHADRDQIDRVTLTGKGGSLLLARRGQGFWIESPAALRDPVDRDLMDGLLSDLTGLRADRFVDDPKKTPSELGLAPPKGVVEAIVRGSATPLLVEIGGPVPSASTPPATPPPVPPGETPPPAAPPLDAYARTAGQLIETQSGLRTQVDRAPADWRSRLLSSFQVHQVDSARVTDPAGAIALSRNGTDWNRGKDLVSYTPVSDFLFDLTGAKADRLLSPAEAKSQGMALDKPALTVAMKGKDVGEETVTIYPPAAAGVPARVSGRDTVLLLPKDKWAAIEKQLAAVRAAKPLPPEPKAKP